VGGGGQLVACIKFNHLRSGQRKRGTLKKSVSFRRGGSGRS